MAQDHLQFHGKFVCNRKEALVIILNRAGEERRNVVQSKKPVAEEDGQGKQIRGPLVLKSQFQARFMASQSRVGRESLQQPHHLSARMFFSGDFKGSVFLLKFWLEAFRTQISKVSPAGHEPPNCFNRPQTARFPQWSATFRIGDCKVDSGVFYQQPNDLLVFFHTSNQKGCVTLVIQYVDINARMAQ